jgi:uncharacterized OB-fold protein
MTEADVYNKPIPVPSPETEPFWEGCTRHELLIPRCDQCGSHWFPPSILCPECLSTEWQWIKASGKGKIFAFGVYHRVYHQGFKEEVPYTVAVVELEEGPRIVSNVTGIPPTDVKVDMPVEVYFDDITPDATLYKFRPA